MTHIFRQTFNHSN